MKPWTVVGLWEDNGQTYAGHVEADNQYRAMGIVGAKYPGLTIIGAISGHHYLRTPGDDNDSAASGADMASLLA